MSKDILAIAGSAAVLLLAVALVFVLSRVKEKLDGATFVAILLAPLLVYGILSGRLAEFSAAGVSAKFQAIAESEIDPSAVAEGAVQLDVIAKDPSGAPDALREFVARLDPTHANAVSLEVGRQGYYVREAIETYIRTLQSAGSATYVIFIDFATKRFVGSANSEQVLALLASEATREEFMRELDQPGAPPFSEFRFLVREALAPTDTNADALDKFLSSGAQALVVLDQGGKPTGVLDRDRLVTKLMRTLAAGGG